MTGNRPSQPSSSSRSKLIAGGAFAVVALALVLAIVLSGSNGDNDSGGLTEYGEPTISGEALAPIDEATVGSTDDAAVGMRIPDVTGQNFSGDTVEIKNDGQAKAILFVSHSCGHCQDEIPEVKAWLDETGGIAGVDVIAVSTGAAQVGGNWPPSEWLAREGWSSPVIADDESSSVFAAYGGRVVPYWVFVDADGTVTRRWAGRMDPSVMEIAMMETLS